MTNDKCLACRKRKPLDRAHLKSRGAGAGWAEHEWIHLCRWCHVVQHQRGWKFMTQRSPWLIDELKEKGWEIVEIFGVWKLRRINGR